MKIIISIFAAIAFQPLYAQQKPGSFYEFLRFSNEVNGQNLTKPDFAQADVRTTCFFNYSPYDPLVTIKSKASQLAEPTYKVTFLRVQGNVLYDYNYNSRMDTPYFQNDVHQHTIQTHLNILVNEQYPIKVFFTVSFGNSNMFNNFSNLNLQFDRADFTRNIKQKLSKAISSVNLDSLNILERLIDEKAKQIAHLKRSHKYPSYLQKQVEALERQTFSKQVADEPDSTLNLLAEPTLSTERIIKEKDFIDSVTRHLEQLQSKYKLLKSIAQLSTAKHRERIETVSTPKELKQIAGEIGLSDTALPKGYKFLMNIRSFGVGRCFIDYSELSAKNVTVKGVSIEYNPGYYFAVAGGMVDYRYRDFILRGSGNDQYLALARLGKGFKEGNHIFFTYYTGRKRFYNSYTSSASIEPNFTLMGITVEVQQKLAKNTFLTAEVAKSSSPYYHRPSGSNNNFKSAFDFHDASNQAYSLKFRSHIENTNTHFSASYKSTGANFQSFSLFNTGTKQSAWSFRIDQPFFKQQLLVSSSLRVNDFSNPFIAQQFSSKAVFKTLQATLRVKKLPVISIGYYPSSQISKINEATYMENVFHTFNLSAFHYYRIQQALLNTGLVFTQFYNRASDSNFIYFNTKNLMLAHSISLYKWNINLNGMYSSNLDYSLMTLEGTTRYEIRSWLRVGGGIKYNRLSQITLTRLGYSGSAIINIPKFGDVQLIYDKGFIPGVSKNLVNHTIARLTYSKTF